MGVSCLCFQLRRAARAVTQHFDANFAPAGLKATQFTVLSAVSAMGPTSIGALAEWLVTDVSTLSRNLALLQRRGLLRATAGSDRRVRDIRLTAAGRRAVARAYPFWQRAQDRIAGELGADEIRSALAALSRITQHAIAATGEKTAGRRGPRQIAVRRATSIS